jgi:hypothetical protein
MRRRFLGAITAIAFAALTTVGLAACGVGVAPGNEATGSAAYPLPIRGDVQGDPSVSDVRVQKNPDAQPGDRGFEGTDLIEFLGSDVVSGTPREIYFVSRDGFTSMIAYEGASEVYVYFTNEDGWRVAAPRFPISTNAKGLASVVVVADDSKTGLRIVEEDGAEALLPMGRILTSPLTSELHLEGTSEKEDGEQTFRSSVFTSMRSFFLKDLWNGYGGEPFAVVTTDGGKYLTDGSGRFIVNDYTLDYAERNGQTYETVDYIEIR